MFRSLMVCLALVASTALVATVAAAEEKTHVGVVVSTGVGQLVMTDKDGKNEHTHLIGPTVKVLLDGKESKLADLAKGDMVQVTMGSSGLVTTVSATRAIKR
ncbi:MAG: hypothetical protein SFU86_12180 [Pirellulaceae bacterium]|nr:hypothetical protein [Pirellulaceae bacterium]